MARVLSLLMLGEIIPVENNAQHQHELMLIWGEFVEEKCGEGVGDKQLVIKFRQKRDLVARGGGGKVYRAL